VELPAGGTPSTSRTTFTRELGHRCRGARVDGAMVPLNTHCYRADRRDRVGEERRPEPRLAEVAELGYLQSARSRAKVRQWFNALEFEQSVAAGREIVEKELQALGKTATKAGRPCPRLGFNKVDELCAAATKEEFSIRSIEQALAPVGQAEELRRTSSPVNRVRPRRAAARCWCVGVDSLLTQLAPAAGRRLPTRSRLCDARGEESRSIVPTARTCRR